MKGIRMIKFQFLIKKRKEKISAKFFLSTLVYQHPGSGSGFNESGSPALKKTLSYWSKTTDQ
jgi:hypothetical protein